MTDPRLRPHFDYATVVAYFSHRPVELAHIITDWVSLALPLLNGRKALVEKNGKLTKGVESKNIIGHLTRVISRSMVAGIRAPRTLMESHGIEEDVWSIGFLDDFSTEGCILGSGLRMSFNLSLLEAGVVHGAVLSALRSVCVPSLRSGFIDVSDWHETNMGRDFLLTWYDSTPLSRRIDRLAWTLSHKDATPKLRGLFWANLLTPQNTKRVAVADWRDDYERHGRPQHLRRALIHDLDNGFTIITMTDHLGDTGTLTGVVARALYLRERLRGAGLL